jgi:hypothetical protein
MDGFEFWAPHRELVAEVGEEALRRGQLLWSRGVAQSDAIA